MLMAPSQARGLANRVFKEANEAIAAAGFTPAAAARRARFPEDVVENFFARKKLIGAFALGRLMRACKVPAPTVTKVLTTMATLEEGYGQLQIWEPPELDMSDFELRIATSVELAKLLFHLQKKSGLPKLQLAVQSGIPRSQLYNLIDPERYALPRNRDQLYAFLRTCSLSEQQTELVLCQWDQLDQQRYMPATVPPDSLIDLPVTPAIRAELPDEPSLDDPQALVNGPDREVPSPRRLGWGWRIFFVAMIFLVVMFVGLTAFSSNISISQGPSWLAAVASAAAALSSMAMAVRSERSLRKERLVHARRPLAMASASSAHG